LIDESYLQYLIDNPEEIAKLNFEKISEILNLAIELFEKEPLLIELSVNEDCEDIIVIGDIHGSLEGLKKVLKVIEEKDPKYIIFLGDIVDRGPYQLECLIIVLALKIIRKDLVYLLRGNHETIEMNQAYGFFYDFIEQFEKTKFLEVLRVYKALPFCLIINNKILCLHGGIPGNLDILNYLKGLNRDDVNGLQIGNLEKELIQMMWNDPKPNLKGFRDSFRGPGVYDFGKDVFEEFMQKNNLKYLIRAHECFPEGYRWFFKKRLLSIFSAPNYRKSYFGNPGSYAIISKGQIRAYIFT